MLKKIKILVASLALALSAISGAIIPSLTVSAEEESSSAEKTYARIHISPTNQKISLNPGDKYTGEFSVINKGNVDFQYKVYATPYSVTNDNYDPDYTAETNYTDISSWITFAKDTGTLSPGEEATVLYMINVPDDAPGGGQYAMLMAETFNDEKAQMVTTTSRVGMILYARLSGETRIAGSIIENNVPTIVFTPPISVSSLIENTGNVHETATYTLRVYPFGSSEEAYTNEETPKTLTILPETRRYVTQSWDGTPSLGLYTVEQVIEFAGQTSTTSKLVIICPIWLLIIFIALFLAIIFTIASRARARKQDRTRSSATKKEEKTDKKD